MGIWPDFNDGIQFSKDSAYLSQFFREMTPDLSDHNQDIPAINSLVDKIDDNILVTHSAGGVPGWIVAAMNPKVKAVVAYEPGAFVFSEEALPEAIDGKTGGTRPIPVKREQFMQLTKIPIVMYFGDYIPETVSNNLGDENWRVRLQVAKKFVEMINNNDENATLVELPKQGIKGNTHFLMQYLNNEVLADLLAKWLQKNNSK